MRINLLLEYCGAVQMAPPINWLEKIMVPPSYCFFVGAGVLGNEFNSCRSGKVYNSYSATVGGYLMLFVIYVIYYSRHIHK